MADETDSTVVSGYNDAELLITFVSILGFTTFLIALGSQICVFFLQFESNSREALAALFVCSASLTVVLLAARIRFLVKIGFRCYGISGTVVALVCAVGSLFCSLLREWIAPPGALPLICVGALLLGLALGICLQWWVYVWGALYFSASKRRMFSNIIISAGLAAVVALLDLMLRGSEALLMSTGVSFSALVLCSACAQVLMRFLNRAYREFGIHPEMQAGEDSFRIAKGSRPLMTVTCGVTGAVYLLLLYHQYGEPGFQVTGEAAVILAAVFLGSLTLIGRTIPKIEWVDSSAAFSAGLCCLVLLVGFSPLYKPCYFLLGVFVVVYGLCLMNGAASFVPLFGCRPMDACNALLSKYGGGFTIGMGLACLLAFLRVSEDLWQTTLLVFVIVLVLLEPLLFPRKDPFWRKCYNFSNECDVLIEKEHGQDAAGENGILTTVEEKAKEGIARCPQDDLTPIDLQKTFDFTDMACSALATRYSLTAREEEVLKLLSVGRSANVIAEKLFISYNTAKTHIYNIYGKMEICSKQDLLDIVDIERSNQLDILESRE